MDNSVEINHLYTEYKKFNEYRVNIMIESVNKQNDVIEDLFKTFFPELSAKGVTYDNYDEHNLGKEIENKILDWVDSEDVINKISLVCSQYDAFKKEVDSKINEIQNKILEFYVKLIIKGIKPQMEEEKINNLVKHYLSMDDVKKYRNTLLNDLYNIIKGEI